MSHELPEYADAVQDEHIDPETFPVEKADSEYSDEKGLPPPYVGTRRQTFPVVNAILSRSISVFPSNDSYSKYKSFSKSNSLAADLQSQGYGMPIFISKRSWAPNRYLNGRKAVIPLLGVFDKKRDTEDFYTVKKKTGMKFSKYTINFVNGEEVMLFYHHILPIADYEYRGQVYRWINYRKFGYTFFYYTLFQMGSERVFSLVDSYNKKTGKMGKDPAFSWLNLAKPKNWYQTPELFKGGTSMGELRETSLFGRFQSTILLDNKVADDLENMKSVDDDMLVHMAVALTIKMYEDDLEDRRRASN